MGRGDFPQCRRIFQSLGGPKRQSFKAAALISSPSWQREPLVQCCIHTLDAHERRGEVVRPSRDETRARPSQEKPHNAEQSLAIGRCEPSLSSFISARGGSPTGRVGRKDDQCFYLVPSCRCLLTTTLGNGSLWAKWSNTETIYNQHRGSSRSLSDVPRTGLESLYRALEPTVLVHCRFACPCRAAEYG